jgi:hypothetical protein
MRSDPSLERLSVAAKLRTEYLSDHPQVLPTLKEWFATEWASHYGRGGPGNAQHSESISTHPHLSSWAAAAMVQRDHRIAGRVLRCSYSTDVVGG